MGGDESWEMRDEGKTDSLNQKPIDHELCYYCGSLMIAAQGIYICY